jgi:hypothetical protein
VGSGLAQQAAAIAWANDAWSGLGTGIVTGVMTGLVALGLFYSQRKVDRKDAREQLVGTALELIEVAGMRFMDQVGDALARREKVSVEGRDTWFDTLANQGRRIRSKALLWFLRDGFLALQEYSVRFREIEAAHPASDDGDEDPAFRAAVFELNFAMRDYMELFLQGIFDWRLGTEARAPEWPEMLGRSYPHESDPPAGATPTGGATTSE